MTLWESYTYRNDVIDSLSTIDMDSLKGKNILVTGATGLICSAVIDVLLACNMQYSSEIKVYADGRNIDKIRARFPHGVENGLCPVLYDATETPIFDFHSDFIIAGAGNANPDKYINEPVDTMLANINGINQLMKYAVTTKSEKVVYISSSEVYGKLANGESLIESEYGNVDILAVRSSYPMGKRASETLCISYAKQHGVNVSIVRPGHIYGPTAQQSDNRVSSLFAWQAAKKENLIMKSAGTQLRSYCHCIDCASAILTVLIKGLSMQAYNISNISSVITIREMAEYIAGSAGVQLIVDLASEKEKAAFNPMDNSSLNSEKLEALGWTGKFDAHTGFDHTIKALREMMPA